MKKPVLGTYSTPKTEQEARATIQSFIYYSYYLGLFKTKWNNVLRYAAGMMKDIEDGFFEEYFKRQYDLSRRVIYTLISVCCQYDSTAKDGLTGENAERLNRWIMFPIEDGLFDGTSFSKKKANMTLDLRKDYYRYIRRHKDAFPLAYSAIESYTDYLTAEFRRIERNETELIDENGKPYSTVLLEILMKIKNETEILIVPKDTPIQDYICLDDKNYCFEIEIQGYRKDPNCPLCFVKESNTKTEANVLFITNEQQEQFKKRAFNGKQKCIFQKTKHGTLIGKIFCQETEER